MSSCPTCEDNFSSKRKMKIHHAQKHGECIGKQTLECEYCGNEFERYDSQVKRSIYCSKKCLYDANQRQEGKDHPKWSRENKECEICGAEYYPPTYMYDQSRTCSKQCLAELNSEILSGEDSVHWKGGICDDYGKRWNNIRKKILRRDHKCQVCDSKENLHVHHIEPRRSFENVNKANTSDNLITLCRSCHPKVEKEIIKCPKPF